jgi:hypothetical protein
MRRETNALAALFIPALVVFFILISSDPSESMALGILATATPWPSETPTPDRLATPVMPESPTQLDIGRNLYYHHCMPCHGDRGQGLTDEWRQVWVEDHQNCWAHRCHTGQPDEGFAIPRFVPPVSGSPQVLGGFQTADNLFDFLRHTHPPQRPGALSDTECWALTAFLLHENGRLPPNVEVGPGAAERSEPRVGVIATVTLGLLLIVLLWTGKQAIRR